MTKTLKEQFDDEMESVYRDVLEEIKYNAKLFRAMTLSDGGVNTANRLLRAPRVQSGFVALYEANRLDISMEARILKPKYASLFETEELNEARTRLVNANYDVRKCYESD